MTNIVTCKNTYRYSYGYGNINSIGYKLNVGISSTVTNYSVKRVNVNYNDIVDVNKFLINLMPFLLEIDSGDKDDMDGYGEIVTGDTYMYYLVIEYNDILYRGDGVSVTANANWNLMRFGNVRSFTDKWKIIRVHGSAYQIAEFEIMINRDSIYTDDYIADFGNILSNRIKWTDYTESEFNAINYITPTKLSGWYYNPYHNQFLYNSTYALSFNESNIKSLIDVIDVNGKVKIVCSGIEYFVRNNTICEKNFQGTTDGRPDYKDVGFVYFDTTLNKPIYWTGTTWVDATGTDVDATTESVDSSTVG